MVRAVKIWNKAVPAEAGTVSCLVKWKNQYAVLGVAHVLTPTCLGVSPSSRPIVEWSVSGSSEIGMIRNWDLPVSSSGWPQGFSCDAAVATIDDDAATKLVRQQSFLPSAMRTTPISSGEQLYFTGAMSAVTHSTRLQDEDAQADFGYFVYELGHAIPSRTVDVSLRGLIQTDRGGAVRAGDSGCLLRDGAGRAIGILVGVDRLGSYCYFSPLQRILDGFNATLVTDGDPLSKELGRG